ncbi:MAG: hypothetical protein IJ752_07060 [Alphaproteobacteria bacterium]|nr:hypothetical protein [Alphaproteobacteria bacterium]
MTDTSLSLTVETIETLFKQGKCLTFNPLLPLPAYKFARRLQDRFEAENHIKHSQILSKTACLCPDGGYTPDFHYFSNGVLLHRFFHEQEKADGLKRIETFLALHGYKITRTYGPGNAFDPEYDAFLREISQTACQKYPYQEDLYIEALPDKETFINHCFENGNVLLNACRTEALPPESRQYMALFSNGFLFVSEEYKDITGINDPKKLYDFKRTVRNRFIFLQRRHIPQSYLDGLYKRAEQYEWFLSETEALRCQPEKKQLTSAEKEKMNDFIENLLSDRTCVSVTIPDPADEFISPERENFALFSDGTLVLDSSKQAVADIFCKHLQKPFPQMTFSPQFVPKYYVPEIYRRLLDRQKSARQIYLEMLKQKAKKLKKKLSIPHHEALELTAKMTGWANWKAATVIEEEQARHVICAEQIKKKMAERQGWQDPVEWEYQNYLKKKAD